MSDMKKIPLTKGKFAIVDDSDFDWLSRWKWYCSTQNRAVRTTGDGKGQKMIYMHREVVKSPPGKELFGEFFRGNEVVNVL